MGASLPAIVRWIETTPRGVSWWGLLYGGNTAGAVFGCLLAGFYLLRIYDTVVATYWAMAVNLLVAAASYLVAGRVPAHGAAESQAEAEREAAALAEPAGPRWPVYVTIGLSGASALGAEIVWTRLMGMLMGATVYVFSIILAVFLIGTRAGQRDRVLHLAQRSRASGAGMVPGAAGHRDGVERVHDRRRIALLAHRSVPRAQPVDDVPTRHGAHALDDSAARDAVGREFPLGDGGAWPRPVRTPGRLAGEVYAANTLGSIFGALLRA